MQKILIVGGGLAGACLGFHLKEKGCDVTLIDSGKNVSSTVAAGMINPLVFRRMTKSWRVDEYLPFAINFYQNIEKSINKTIINPIAIRRFFSSEQEKNFWKKRQHNPDFSAYMHELTEEDYQVFPYANIYGSARVKNGYYINTCDLLQFLHSKVQFKQERFCYENLNPIEGLYKDESFDSIIFCEGYESKNNPWFGYIPINSTKGEILTIETQGLSNTESLNRKCFTLPKGNNQFVVGSTYVWNTDDTNITEEGKEELLNHLTFLTNLPIAIINQKAGVRPTTLDRRPVMGRHLTYNKLAIFNGLGTKGYLMAPLLSLEMANFLIEHKELNKECKIERFISKH